MFHTRCLTICAVLFAPVAYAATGDVLLSFPSSFSSPDGLMWDGHHLWATDCSTSRIDRIDPQTGQVVASIDVSGVNSDELAWDGTAMWASDHTATEMPGLGAPAPQLYRINVETGEVLASIAAPGRNRYPMGMAWDGASLWNVDPWDGKIFQLDPTTGAIKRSIPSPAEGACGLAFDGACLWLSDATTGGRVYHIDPASGDVLSSFDGPGGSGHQTTGVAWDGRHLWIHDEAPSRARIYQVQVDDITEGGRCSGALGTTPDGGVSTVDGGSEVAVPVSNDARGGCTMAGTTPPISPLGLGLMLAVLLAAALRPALRRCTVPSVMDSWSTPARPMTRPPQKSGGALR